MQIDSHRGSDGPTAHAICAALVLGFGLLALACDTHDGGEASISNGELAALIREGQAPLIVDVRTPHEYEAGHLPGAVHIPYDELSSRMSELPADKTSRVVVYCQSGKRAGIAQKELDAAGYLDVVELDGHMIGWRSAALETE